MSNRTYQLVIRFYTIYLKKDFCGFTDIVPHLAMVWFQLRNTSLCNLRHWRIPKPLSLFSAKAKCYQSQLCMVAQGFSLSVTSLGRHVLCTWQACYFATATFARYRQEIITPRWLVACCALLININPMTRTFLCFAKDWFLFLA